MGSCRGWGIAEARVSFEELGRRVQEWKSRAVQGMD